MRLLHPSSLKENVKAWVWIWGAGPGFTASESSNTSVSAPIFPVPPKACLSQMLFKNWSKSAHVGAVLFIVGSLRHICAMIMPSHQRLAGPHLGGGWIHAGFVRFVRSIRHFVYVWTLKPLRSVEFELIKINERPNESVHILAQRGRTCEIASAVQRADGRVVRQNHKWLRSDGPLASVDCDVCRSRACSSLRRRFIKNEWTSRWQLLC